MGTVRRRLQKRAKRDRYGKCLLCGARTRRAIESVWGPDFGKARHEFTDLLIKRCQVLKCGARWSV